MLLVPTLKAAIHNQMLQNNYQRMLELIDEVFALRNDNSQLQVTDEQQKHLRALHPATLSELANDAGPLIWCLMVPTTNALRDAFLEGRLNENELLDQTPENAVYESIYLCSVTALPEIRKTGKSYALCEQAIKAISSGQPISSLFVWPFTPEGKALAEKLSKNLQLSLLIKQS